MKKICMLVLTILCIAAMFSACGEALPQETTANTTAKTEGDIAPENTVQTGYHAGEAQRPQLMYNGIIYFYEALGRDFMLPSSFSYVGKIQKTDIYEPDEELEGARVELGQEIYANSDEPWMVYVQYSTGFAKFTDPENPDCPRQYTFQSSVAWANWSDDPKIKDLALNKDKLELNRHIPVYRCDTAEDLEAFKASFSDVFTMDSSWDEVPSFEAVTAGYDEKFFEEYDLLLVYVESGSCTPRFRVESVFTQNGTLTVSVECVYNPEALDCAMAGWLFTVGIINQDWAQNCTSFDAVLR